MKATPQEIEAFRLQKKADEYDHTVARRLEEAHDSMRFGYTNSVYVSWSRDLSEVRMLARRVKAALEQEGWYVTSRETEYVLSGCPVVVLSWHAGKPTQASVPLNVPALLLLLVSILAGVALLVGQP